MKKVKIQLNVISLALLSILYSCSSIRMSYEANVKDKKTKLSKVFVYEKSYGLGYLCPITAYFLGGTCWTYLNYPDEKHISKTKTDAEEKLNKELGIENWEISGQPFITKISWANQPEQFSFDKPTCNNQITLTSPTQNKELILKLKDFDVQFTIKNKADEIEAGLMSRGVQKSSRDDYRSSNLDYDIGFKIDNKTSIPAKIIWDESSYISLDGESHEIIHSGIKYSTKSNSQTPTTIAPKSSYSDVIIPKDFISYENSDWRFSQYKFGECGHIGKEFGVLLTLDLAGRKQILNFKFRLSGPN